jgi:hypothetical protein
MILVADEGATAAYTWTRDCSGIGLVVPWSGIRNTGISVILFRCSNTRIHIKSRFSVLIQKSSCLWYVFIQLIN